VIYNCVLVGCNTNKFYNNILGKATYSFLSVLSTIYPDDDPLGSEHVATETTKNKIMLIVF
jgi:hypothetical protein